MAFSKEEIEEWPQLQGSLFVTNAIARGLVVHEAVHAVMGWEGRRTVILSDEAAAYLAETLYHVGRGTYDTYLDSADDKAAHLRIAFRQIVETARELITGAESITEHQLDSEPGRHLNWLQYRALRKAIHAHPEYRHLGPTERWD